jgi:hypothetical protein
MEALLEKEGAVENWNDERLDELARTMKEGFAKSDLEMKEGFRKVGQSFEQIDRKLEQLPTRVEIDNRFDAANREANQRFESAERRIDRVSTRFEHMVWATIAVAGGFLGNLLAGKF